MADTIKLVGAFEAKTLEKPTVEELNDDNNVSSCLECGGKDFRVVQFETDGGLIKYPIVFCKKCGKNHGMIGC